MDTPSASIPVYPPGLRLPLSQSGSSDNASPMDTALRSPIRRRYAGSRRSRLPGWTTKLLPPLRLHLDGVRVELASALRVDLDPLDAALENAPLAVQREVRPQATNVLRQVGAHPAIPLAFDGGPFAFGFSLSLGDLALDVSRRTAARESDPLPFLDLCLG